MATIEHKTIQSNTGMKKEIDESSLFLIFDVLQGSLYTKPIESSIRESVSNSMDSIKEKKIAKSILKGEAKIEDFYDESNVNESSVDSKFDSSYYDLKYLSDDETVRINYIVNQDLSGRDTIEITDNGVGLGGKRLIGWTKLGYSSKRLTKNQLGGFGLGCKSPLSTGIESFRMTSRYNGQEFCFDVFNDKIDSVYGKWNEDGSQNEYFPIPTSSGVVFKAYYHKIPNSKNGVTISFDVKKHNKESFIRAIRSQLMYLKEDIKFKITDGSYTYDQKIKSTILYEDDNIIISDDSFYSRPHFVMKGITYGMVDFKELELPERNVSIGIKVEMEEVDVIPSRESIQYTAKTKETIINKLETVNKLIQERLNNQLKSNDFFEWQNSLYAINSLNDRNSPDVVISRLGKLIDKSSLSMDFKGVKGSLSRSKFYGNYIRCFNINRTNVFNKKTSKNNYSYTINEQDHIMVVDPKKIVFSNKTLGNKAKKYFYDNNFVLFDFVSSGNDEIDKILIDENIPLAKKELQIIEIIKKESKNQLHIDDIVNNAKRSIKTFQYIKESAHLQYLDQFSIPEDDDEEEEEDDKPTPKIKKKANRSLINLKTGKHEFKLDKQDIPSRDYYYYLNTNDKAKELVNEFGRFCPYTEGNNTYTGIGFDKLIVSLAPGNERYVKDHWTLIDGNTFEAKVNDDKTIDIKFHDYIIEQANDIYTKKLYSDLKNNAPYVTLSYYSMSKIFTILKDLKIVIENIDFNDKNFDKDKFFTSLNEYYNSDVYSLSKKARLLKIDTILKDNTVLIENESHIVSSHNLENDYNLSFDAISKLCLLQSSNIYDVHDIKYNMELYANSSSEVKEMFDKLFLQIYNKITKS